MSNGLRITVPVKIVDPMLTATDVPEADFPAWAVGTTYALNDKCIKGHQIWASGQAGNVGNDPEIVGQPLWLKVSATNRWSLFDLEQVTRTTRPGNMYYEIQPGAPVDSIHLLGLTDVDYAQVRIYEGVALKFDSGQNASGLLPTASDWWVYCYGPWALTDQQHYKGLPYVVSPKIRVDFGADSPQSVQVLILGNDTVFGDKSEEGVYSGVRVRYDRSSGFSDNGFDIPTMKKSALIATVSFTLRIKSSGVDELNDFYKAYGEKVCLFSIAEMWRTTQVLGVITSFETLIQGPTYSEFSFEVRGVPQQ